jgi:protein-L-isoaspartate(D-aspartate) O-methyltransferase
MESLSLEAIRRWYADEVRWASGVADTRIISAFASVPRESFLTPGPWHFSTGMMTGTYQVTPNGDLHHLYHNVMVALDPTRELNTAVPSYMANVLDLASVKVGASVAQIGAGLGYYSAIIAHLVGPEGSLLALEIDPTLAQRCHHNLSHYQNVRCVQGDGGTYPFKRGSLDVLLVHGAATQVPKVWLDSLKPNGRIVVNFSYSPDCPGQLTRITRNHDRFLIEFHHEVFAYPCVGMYTEQGAEALQDAVETYGWYTKSEVRFDLEHLDDSAWLVTPEYWISMTEPAEAHHLLVTFPESGEPLS